MVLYYQPDLAQKNGHLCKLHTNDKSRSVNSKHHAHLVHRMFGAIFRHKNIFIFGFLQKTAFGLSQYPDAYRFLLTILPVLASRHLPYFTVSWSPNGRGRLAVGHGS